jgi:hypothetical protein
MISSSIRKVGPFVGNGSASVFPFTFKVFSKADLVVVWNLAGAETTLTVDSDYTVSLNADQDASPGGSITLTAGALGVGYTLIISSDIDQTQQTELTNLGGFYPEVITASLDKLTILVQQLQEKLDRAVLFPITDPAINSEMPSVALRRGHVLAFDSNSGAPIALTPTLNSIGSGTNLVTFSAMPEFDLSLGSQQTITLTGDVTSSTLVTANGAPTMFVMRIQQDGTGGHLFAWPTNFDNAGAVNTVANSTSVQVFAVDSNGRATAAGPIMYS